MMLQLYSIIILLFASINCMQDTTNSIQDAASSSTQLSLIPNTISVAKTPEESVTSTTKAPDDHKTSAPENITPVTKAPKSNTTSVAKTSHETTNKITVPSEVLSSKATSAPSLPSNLSPLPTTKEFIMTTRSDSISATGSISISIGKETLNPTLAGNATAQQISEVTNATRPTSTKATTVKATGNRTSAFPVPLLFAIMLLVVSGLCF